MTLNGNKFLRDILILELMLLHLSTRILRLASGLLDSYDLACEFYNIQMKDDLSSAQIRKFTIRRKEFQCFSIGRHLSFLVWVLLQRFREDQIRIFRRYQISINSISLITHKNPPIRLEVLYRTSPSPSAFM